jgi:hypothetical protein
VKLLDIRFCDVLILCQPEKQVIGLRMAQGFQVIPDGLSPDGDPVLDEDLRLRLGQRVPFQGVA